MANLCFHFFFSMFSSLCLMVCSTLCQTNFTMNDELALLSFKFSVRDPYSHLANWSNSSSICNWVGVTCDSNHERVSILNLGEMDLKGTLPSQIGNLSLLVELDLHSNNFYGDLPKELLQLHKLEILNLSHNAFSGEIPPWIGSLSTLKHLILRKNSFEGIIPPSISNLSKLENLDWNYNFIKGSIPLEIGRLQHLKILQISMNNLSGIIPSTISNLSSLEKISFSFNSLAGEIPKEINELMNLKILYFGVNKLSGHIPTSIGNLTMLQQLELGVNSLQGDIPNEICDLSNLKSLVLDTMQLSGHIPRTIGNLTMLQELSLNRNNLEGSIPMEIGNLHKLETLHLSHNKLSGSIPSKTFNMSTLELLAVANNSLSGGLPSDFGSGLSNLQEMQLWGNKLSGRIPNTISNASNLAFIELEDNKFDGVLPSTLGHLRYLESVRIFDNNLTIIDAPNSETSFFSSLSNCRHLTFMDLSINPLDITLPKSIGNISDSLQDLVMYSCGVSGNIPSEIGNLTNLITLELDENVLSGQIPTTISSLQVLQYLNVEGNELQGLIVNEICEIRRLTYLKLTGNKLFGAMPPCLGNLTSLLKLHLGSNRLSSEIPSSFWNLKNILEVNLSSNNLVGNLSSRIENLNALTLLDLSRNYISNSIPITMGDLQYLQILTLALNKLQGNIPESFQNLISLVYLDLSQNDLSSKIPKSLESLTYLKFVNLSYNKLQGEIPSGGVFKNLIAKSFMMNEALCGRPQLNVPPCKTGRRKRSMTKLLLLTCIVPIIMLAILLVLGIILLRHKPVNSRDPNERDLSTIRVPRWISYFEILEATNGFDESNLLGRGSYGAVFKGKLSSGIIVAIKIFNFDSEIMSRSFEVECNTMRNVRHRNLVKIISSCSNVDFKSLIMEYMPNGSLEKWLYSHNYCLDFLQRLNVMINVASALEYLHHGLSIPVVHCDLKPSNILLDDDMVAHVSDFGISKLLDEGQYKTLTKTIPTVGYIAPEYGSGGIVSTKVDVYSYGIMLLEVFTRKKPTEDMFVSEFSLKSWVSKSMPYATIQVIDSNLLNGDEQHSDNILASTSSIFEVALNCCTDFPETRNNMIDVVVLLNKIKVMFMQRQQHHI